MYLLDLEAEFEVYDWIVDLMRIRVRSGYYSRRQLISEVISLDKEMLESDASRLVDSTLYWQMRRQSDATDFSSYENLELAFSELEREGIIARPNFKCCNTCAMASINDEMACFSDSVRPAVGFACFHEQDTDHAVEYGDLYVRFGSANENESDDDRVRIGTRVVDILEMNDMCVEWNGTAEQCINVSIHWDRKLSLPILEKARLWWMFGRLPQGIRAKYRALRTT